MRGDGARNVVGALRRRGWIALLVVLVIPAGVYLYTAHQAKVYQARMTVQADAVAAADLFSGQLVTNPNNVFVLNSGANTPQVAAATARSLHQPYGSVGGLTAGVDETTGWMTLSATAPSAQLAVAAANAYFRATTDYAQRTARLQVRAAIAATRQRLAITEDPVGRSRLVVALRRLTTPQVAGSRPLQVVQAPVTTVVSPHPRRNAGLGLVLALLIAPLPVLVLERLDRRVRSAAELETLFGVPLLATVSTSDARNDREFQRLRDSLMSFKFDRPLDTLMVVSPLKGEGRTTVAAGLASSLRRAGKRVVLLDAGTLGSEQTSTLLKRHAEDFDLVIVDTAPLLEAGETLALIGQVSAIIAVARINRTPRDAVRRMTQIATAAGGRFVGVVAT
jgi:Mrp family chromosome partitioning ATPase